MKPRLIGERFDGGEIPLEILSDLSVLSSMIIEVAKWKYRESSSSRKRVPRGFTDGITLKLKGVDEGSALPNIVLAFSGLLSQLPAFPYIVDAREAVIAAVSAAEAGTEITKHLPPKLLVYFDRLGRNLGAGESIEFNPGNERPARLTLDTRRLLLRASEQDGYSQETSVYGLVHDFNHASKTFQMTLPGGFRLAGIQAEPQHYDTILEAHTGYRAKTRVRIEGIGIFDRDDRPRGFEQIEHVMILDPLDVTVRIDELSLLEYGWLGDDEGLPLDKAGLGWLAGRFIAIDFEKFRLPYLFPTPEGNVLAEWSIAGHSVSLEIDLLEKEGQWHDLNLVTNEETEMSFDLSNHSDWLDIAKRIGDLVGDGE